jgi:hypothetical protein
LPGQQNNVNPVIRLFDNQGRDLGLSSGVSASLDYTALASGTYYVGVSGRGNDQYDPRSLGNRLPANSVGDYRIAINVMAPRTWVITAQGWHADSRRHDLHRQRRQRYRDIRVR